MRRCVAISASVRSTSWVSSSGVSFASEVGSISPRHSVRNSTIAAPGGSFGAGGGSAALTTRSRPAARPAGVRTRPGLPRRTAGDAALIHRPNGHSCLHPRCAEAADRSGERRPGTRLPPGRPARRSPCGTCRRSAAGSPMLAAFSTTFGRSGIAMSTFIFSASSTCWRVSAPGPLHPVEHQQAAVHLQRPIRQRQQAQRVANADQRRLHAPGCADAPASADRDAVGSPVNGTSMTTKL